MASIQNPKVAKNVTKLELLTWARQPIWQVVKFDQNILDKNFCFLEFIIGFKKFLLGLNPGDRIIEINNQSVMFFNYDQIVKQIKDGLKVNGKCYQDEVLLLVYSQKKKKNTFSDDILKLDDQYEEQYTDPEDSELVIFI